MTASPSDPRYRSHQRDGLVSSRGSWYYRGLCVGGLRQRFFEGRCDELRRLRGCSTCNASRERSRRDTKGAVLYQSIDWGGSSLEGEVLTVSTQPVDDDHELA